ncbi:hypothetical protein ACFW15_35995, partial [Streptomyces sp. NPDC058953]
LRPGLAEVEQEPAEAVRAGWLDDTAPDADPARAALAASDAEKTAVAAWDTARETGRTAAERAKEAAAAESRAELAAARAADAAAAAENAHTAEDRAAASIAEDPRLAELLSLPAPATDTPGSSGTSRPGPATRTDGGPLTAAELDRWADDLRALLDQYVTAAERQLFDLRTAAADDARIRGALGDGGLLPPGPDVLATVEYLAEHGIPALPGWRYLAQAVDPADHAAVLAARPELVDGVVITDPASHDRAREVLGGAALLPRSAVAVGTAAALLAPVPHPGAGPAADSGVFLVPPNPAMHDEGAADEERRADPAGAHDARGTWRAVASRRPGDPRGAGRR